MAYLFAVNGIARDRRGNAWSLAWIGRWWRARGEGRWGWSTRRGEDAGRDLGIDFLDIYFADEAQAWLEWRTKGRALPLSVAGLLAGMWFCFAVFRVEPADVSGALGGLSMMFVLGAPFLGLLMGSSSGGFDLKPFAATRPMSDGDLASSVLRNAAVSFGIAAAIWLPGLLLTSIVWQPDEWLNVPRDSQGWETCERMISQFVVLTLASWTLLGLGTALAMAGCRFVLWGGLGAGALGLSVVVGLSNGPPIAEEIVVPGLAALCFCGTAAIFRAARRRSLLSGRTQFGCVLGYALLLGIHRLVVLLRSCQSI